MPMWLLSGEVYIFFLNIPKSLSWMLAPSVTDKIIQAHTIHNFKVGINKEPNKARLRILELAVNAANSLLVNNLSDWTI